jgi:predicted TIM-barrel fold metal-dependent hydrolase
VFASDIPHWDGEFPGNLNHIRETADLTADQKKKILYDNPKSFFRLS